MRRTQIQLFSPIRLLGGDFVAELYTELSVRNALLEEFTVGEYYSRITKKARFILHLDGQLFLVWHVEKPNAFLAHSIVGVLIDAGVLDV